MSEKMMKNIENIQRRSSSLAQNVDNLRASVMDLYSLDEDNYRAIIDNTDALRIARNELDKLKKRVDVLSTQLANFKARRALGIIGAIGLGWLVYEGLKELLSNYRRRIEALENQIKKEEEKAEESDG